MKLLFDQNLSPRLASSLADLFAGSVHVQSVALDAATDAVVWNYAGTNGFTIVSKDSDFSDLATLKGPPPKVIAITLGNCSTAQIESLLRMRAAALIEFETSQDAILFLP